MMNTIVKPIEETYNIRGEKIKITADALFNKDTGEQLYDENLDTKAIEKVSSIYRERHNIFSPKRIKKLREVYKLTQRDFAALLGWSPTTIATYETGSLPTKSNNLVFLQLETDTTQAKFYYKYTKNDLSENGQKKMQKFIAKITANKIEKLSTEYIYAIFKKDPSIMNGFTEFDLMKTSNMIVFFITNVSKVTKTKLNKLLFYTDFKYFKEEVASISGLCYARLPYGPVPDKFENLYSTLNEMGIINVHYEYENNYYTSNYNFDSSIFSSSELKIMNDVAMHLGNKNAKYLSKISHEETAWKDVDTSHLISYKYAQNLKI